MLIMSGVSRGLGIGKTIIPEPPAPPPSGDSPWLLYPPPASPYPLPTDAKINGDSNTGGRPSSMFPTSESPHALMGRILVQSGYTQYSTYASPSDVDSQGGRTIANTMIAAVNDPGGAGSWIHVEESGDQNKDGQRTPEEFGDTFEAGWRSIYAVNPTGYFTTAQAPNYGRTPGARWYDWSTKAQWPYWGVASEEVAIAYNDEMLRRIDILALDGIIVRPIFFKAREDEAAALLPNGYTDLYSDTNPYHWSACGRLLEVMEKLRCLGYDCNTLDFSTVSVHTDSTTSSTMKAALLTVINNVMEQFE